MTVWKVAYAHAHMHDNLKKLNKTEMSTVNCKTGMELNQTLKSKHKKPHDIRWPFQYKRGYLTFTFWHLIKSHPCFIQTYQFLWYTYTRRQTIKTWNHHFFYASHRRFGGSVSTRNGLFETSYIPKWQKGQQIANLRYFVYLKIFHKQLMFG